MPLVNDQETKRVEFDNGDWYDLKKDLGFYDNTVSIWGDYTIEETRQKEADAVVKEVAAAAQGDQNGDLGIEKEISAGQYIARTHVTRIYARIAGWSHDEPITMANVRRIPPDQARQLMADIRELEAESHPFLVESETDTSA